MLLVSRITISLLAGCSFLAVAGCASTPPPAPPVVIKWPRDVPPAAVLKTEGDQRIVYTADAAGVVWVSNSGTNDILYSGAVSRGDRLVLDPAANRLTLNDVVIANKDISFRDHQVYFQAGPAVPAAQVTQDAAIARPGQVPMAASLKGEGKQLVEYTPNTDGAIWVTDTDTGTIVYSGRVLRGETVVVNPMGPKDGQLTVARRPVSSGDLPSHNRRIFFQTGAALTPGGDAPALPAVPAAATVSPTARPVEVSLNATLRTEGGGAIRFVTDVDGTVWVVDASTNMVVYSGRMLSGDILSVDPLSGRLTLNSRAVNDHTLPHGDRYSVFFLGTGL